MEKHDTMHTIEISHKIRKNHTLLLTQTYSMAFFRTFSLQRKKSITEDKTVLSYSGTSLISSINSISHNYSLINSDIQQLQYKQHN